MSNKKLIITIIVLGILFSFLGLLLAMNATGVFDLKAALADMPLIGNRFQVEDELMIVQPIEDENSQLRQEIESLQLLIKEKEKEKGETIKEIEDFNKKITELEKKILDIQQKDVQGAHLAEIYEKMDAKQAVKIFDNLNDDTVISILVKLSSDKTAAFLGAMDPMRAAKLTAVLTDKSINARN